MKKKEKSKLNVKKKVFKNFLDEDAREIPFDRSEHNYDRDKSRFYEANDESIDEVLDNEGYRIVHPNRDAGPHI